MLCATPLPWRRCLPVNGMAKRASARAHALRSPIAREAELDDSRCEGLFEARGDRRLARCGRRLCDRRCRHCNCGGMVLLLQASKRSSDAVKRPVGPER